MNKRVLSILIASALLVSAVPSYAENSGASGEDMQYEDIQYAEDTDIEYEDDTAQLFAELYETTEDGAFEFSIAGETAKITKYTGSDAIVEIPAVITFNDVGYSVTEIDNYAFKGNSSVVKVTVPEGVKKLGTDVFYGCTNLQSITLPEGLEEAGYNLFRECESLTEVTVPSTLKTINNSMFIGCKSLKTVKLQEGLERINRYAFEGCSSLKKLEIPASVTTLDQWIMQYCSGLEFVYFKGTAPANTNVNAFINVSEDTAFYCNRSMLDSFIGDASALKDIYNGINIEGIDDYFQIDENGVLTGINTEAEGVRSKMLIPGKFLDIEITKIGAEAFDAAAGVEIIEIPESVTEIAAEFPAGVKSIYFACSCPENLPAIPAGVTVYVATKYKDTFAGKNIDNFETYYYSMFEKIENEDEISIIGYKSDAEETTRIDIPDNMYGTDVTSIGINAFKNFGYLEVVTIPDSIKEIGAGAFEGCENLYRIGNADNVEAEKNVINAAYIGAQAFRDCVKLRKIVLNDTQVIGSGAFFNCIQLDNVEINGDPEYATDIGGDEPAMGTYIGEAAFCGNLVSGSNPESDNKNIYGSSEGTAGVAPPLTTLVLKNIGVIDQFAFNGSGVKSVELPEGVKVIGKAAFAFCKKLEEIALPKTLEMIEGGQNYNPGNTDRAQAGDGAFSCCEKLDHVEIPENVSSLGSYTFAGSYGEKTDYKTGEKIETGLSSVVFNGNKITTLAYGTFKDCKNLKMITLPSALVALEGTNYADNGVFAGCTALKYVTTSESLASIGTGAFKNCESLEFIKCNPTANAEVSKSLVSIGDSAFENCKSLAAEMPLWLPDTLVSIGRSAFKNCEALTLKDNNISKELTELLDSVFENCKSLTAVNIPEKVTVISSSAFKNSGLVSVMIPSTVAEIKNNAFEQCAALEKLETEAGKDELIIYDRAFRESRALKDIVFERNTVTLQANVFENCTSLADVDTAMVDTINIGNDSFAGCTSLANSGLRRSITASFGARAYKGSGLTSFTVPDNVEELPVGMFMGCTQLAEVNLNSGLTAIRSSENNGTFQECTALKTISLPSELSEIEAYAFTKSGLEKIVLPDKVTVINMDVFAGCSQLYSVKLGGQTTTICGKGETGGDNKNLYVNEYTVRGAFRDCTALESIEFPSTVTDIQPFAFTGSGLKSVVLPDKFTDLQVGVFYKCASLENIVLSDKLKYLREFSLAGCTALSEMEIPGTVSRVHNGAFKNDTSLETVRIGDVEIGSSTYLASYVFGGCDKLSYVIFSGMLPSYRDDVFGDAKPTILYIKRFYDSNWDEKFDMIPIDDMYEYEEQKDGTYSIKSYKGDLPVAIIPAAVSDAAGNNVKITAISAGAFDGDKIKAVSIPKSVKDIDNSIFFGIENLERINVSALNNDYISVDGVLYANAGTTLVYCPQKKTGKFEIDKKVTAVEPGAFYSNSLTSFAVEEGNTVFGTVDGVLVSNGAARIVAYPNGKGTAYTVAKNVTEIADYAFTGDNMIISFETLTAPTINANSIPANTVLKVYPDAVGFDGEAYAEYIVVTKDKPIIDKMEKTGENTVKVSYKNYKEGKIAGKTFAALYSGGEFVELTPQQDISLEVDAEAEKTFEFTQTGDTVKIFIWKSLDKMEPVDENGTIGLN